MNLLEYPKISVSCNLIHQDMRGKDQPSHTHQYIGHLNSDVR